MNAAAAAAAAAPPLPPPPPLPPLLLMLMLMLLFSVFTTVALHGLLLISPPPCLRPPCHSLPSLPQGWPTPDPWPLPCGRTSNWSQGGSWLAGRSAGRGACCPCPAVAGPTQAGGAAGRQRCGADLVPFCTPLLPVPPPPPPPHTHTPTHPHTHHTTHPPSLPCSICLDCIVTVVDARHIRHQLADARPEGGVNEAQQQVAFADVVLLNKVRRGWVRACFALFPAHATEGAVLCGWQHSWQTFSMLACQTSRAQSPWHSAKPSACLPACPPADGPGK